MPDLVMHYYFADRLLEQLEKDARKSIGDKDLYYFASAGPDPFFFYKYYRFKQNAEVAKIGHYMHRNKVYEFFKTLTELTKKDEQNRRLLFSYLCGYIAHHSLDSLVHPYVFHKTGEYIKTKPETIIYRGLHTKLERAMDCYIIRNYFRQDPSKFNIVCEVLNLNKIPEQLKDSFDKLYEEIDVKDGYNLVNESVKWQRKFYNFIYDPYGFKHSIFSMLDSDRMPVALSYISYYKKDIFDRDILNLEKKSWINPSDETIVSDKSVLELFDEALVKAADIILKVYEYIFLDKEIDIEEVLPKVSYLNGLSLDKAEMKYFNNIFA